MLLLKSDFIKDVIVLLVVTIMISSILAITAGYLSDFYFGDAVSSLIGDYGEYDLLIIVDEKMKDKAYQQINDIVKHQLLGSQLVSGVEVAGKANFFIKLADKYRNRKTFLELNEYFRGITGINSLSIITEPKIDIRGLKSGARKFLEPKVNSIPGVDFTFPDGDKLKVIVTKPELLTSVEEKIEEILEEYQVLSVRFPITHKPKELLKLGDQLKQEIVYKYPIEVKNITSTGLTDIDSLVKTMTEMKKFLDSYATKVKITLDSKAKLKEEDNLILPANGEKQVILRVIEVKDKEAIAIVEEGDSRDILGTTAYYLEDDQLGNEIGQIKISNPRQELTYTVTELTKLLPRLDSIFQKASSLLEELMNTVAIFQELDDSMVQIKQLNDRLTYYQQDLTKVDIKVLKDSVNKLEGLLDRLVQVVRKLNFVKELITDVSFKLNQIADNIAGTSQKLSPLNPYRKELEELEVTINQLAGGLNTNTTKIINYINQFNPILQELIVWQENVEGFNKVLQGLDNADKDQIKDSLAKITNQELIIKINSLDSKLLKNNLAKLESDLANLKKIDLRAIIKEVEYIQQSLPKLRDEEITDSMDLIDQYIAGKVIPGGEISLLLPNQGIDLKGVKEEIKSFLATKVTIYTSQPGVISPNLRGQIYQILSEVKLLLTALTGIILTIFALLFDQTLIISSLRLLTDRVNNKWYLDLALYYGVLIGALMLGIIFYITGARIPYLPSYTSFLLGGLLGLVTVRKAEAMNKISKEEFKAGKALGFSYAEIMREIIIPAGKPGILKLLNRRKTYF